MKKIMLIAVIGIFTALFSETPNKCYHMWSSVEGAKALEKIYTLPALKMIYGVENFTGAPAILENGKKIYYVEMNEHKNAKLQFEDAIYLGCGTPSGMKKGKV